MKVKADLAGVPATALLTLHHRALEAGRPDSVLADPKAVEVFDGVEYDFPNAGRAMGNTQWLALRSRAFDGAVREFLAGHPDGMVVCVGEGLETMFWRVDNGRVRWLTVDLPEAIALRRRVLPIESPRQRYLACSVLDPGWHNEVDAERGVLFVVQGLFMYLRPPEVRSVIADCAVRYPGASMVFDTMPRKFADWQRRGAAKAGVTMPTWHWLVDADQVPQLATAHPNVASVREIPYPRGRGVIGHLLPYLGKLPFRIATRPTVTRLTFAAG